MQVEHVIFAPGFGAFFYDDQAAILGGARSDGFAYRAEPRTPGFAAIRIPASSLGIGLVLSDGAIAWGDMMSVQYAGAGGRDALFNAAAAETLVRDKLLPTLQGLEIGNFRIACAAVLADEHPQIRLPMAIKYGISQALLQATAHSQSRTMAEIISEEFDTPLLPCPVLILAQSGDAREINVDKMILKRVDILPHGLINSHEKFGSGGDAFREYVKWVLARIRTLGSADYRPTLHFDVYGWMGLEFGLSIPRIAEFIARLGESVAPLRLNIECPADFGSRSAQIDGYAALVDALRDKGSGARIVVDERCNTLDDVRDFAAAHAGHIAQIKMPDVGPVGDSALAVLACKRHGMQAYMGGSCVETDLSAKVSVHVAVATQAAMMLAKPGMGVDEALSIVGNEQSRLLRLLEWRAKCGHRQ